MSEHAEVTRHGGGRTRRFLANRYLLFACAALIAAGAVVYLLISFTMLAPKENREIVGAQHGLEALIPALSRYMRATGAYPTTDQGLGALIHRPTVPPIPERWIPTTTPANLVDPWGRPYRYRHPGARNPNNFDLWSYGPDGENGTEDDIIGW